MFLSVSPSEGDVVCQVSLKRIPSRPPNHHISVVFIKCVYVFTIVEESSLGEAEFMAVLRLAGIHGFGFPVIISDEVS